MLVLYLDRNNYLSYEDSDIAFKMYEVLKLADMFDVEPLQQRILARIRQDWLTVKSAEDWIKKHLFYNSFKPKQIKNIDGYRLEPASVLRVARQFDPSLITPLLFHYLSFHDPDAVHGQNPPGINGKLRHIPAARWELVSPADRALAGIGWQAVLHWMDKALISCRKPAGNRIRRLPDPVVFFGDQVLVHSLIRANGLIKRALLKSGLRDQRGEREVGGLRGKRVPVQSM